MSCNAVQSMLPFISPHIVWYTVYKQTGLHCVSLYLSNSLSLQMWPVLNAVRQYCSHTALLKLHTIKCHSVSFLFLQDNWISHRRRQLKKGTCRFRISFEKMTGSCSKYTSKGCVKAFNYNLLQRLHDHEAPWSFGRLKKEIKISEDLSYVLLECN